MRFKTLRLIALAAMALLLASACGEDDIVGADDDSVSDDVDAVRDAISERVEELGLSSVSTALQEVDVSELTDTEAFTFFAPSNEAFTGATADELTDLLAEPERLQETLRNHVIDERVTAADLVDRESVTAVSGLELDVVVDGDIVMVGGVTVTETDQEAGDGVIHVVDGLILAE